MLARRFHKFVGRTKALVDGSDSLKFLKIDEVSDCPSGQNHAGILILYINF